MKKSIVLAFALAMPAMAGTPTLVTVPTPAPAASTACCAVEVGGVYRYTSRDLTTVDKAVDTYGIDLTAVHSFNENHAITCRVGYTYGSEVFREDGFSPWRDQLENLSVMPGYRYTHAITDQLSWFAGANAGVVWGKETIRLRDFDKYTDKEWGWAASAEIGLKYQVSDAVYVFAAYELSGTTIKYDYKGTHQQVYHGVRAGVGIKF